MKNVSVRVILVLLMSGCVWGLPGLVKPDSLSLKAGPTEPGEKLSLVWVESFVYPRAVKDERAISLGVRTASKVREVRAAFDFNSEPIKLTSSDGLSWGGALKLPAGISDGVHVVRYRIAGRRGQIQRTIEFFVEKPGLTAGRRPDSAPAEILPNAGWPLTIVASCAAYSGDTTRPLQPGQILVSHSKMMWYKVTFADGKEGWVPSSYVKEPTEDYYLQGYGAYKAKDYKAAVKFYLNAVAVNPNFVKGFFWSAKSYLALGELDLAAAAVAQAVRLDDRDVNNRVLADIVARRYYNSAHEKMRQGRFNEAAAGFRKALDLKPNSLTARLEMGQAFRQLGLEREAQEAWREALRYDPDNTEIRGLLGSEIITASANNAKSGIADESLELLKTERTSKGTRIESALKSVVSLTKSLGTPIAEKGWQVKKQGAKFLVSYLCEQSGGALESFDWLVDVDTRQVQPRNENARVLMSRW